MFKIIKKYFTIIFLLLFIIVFSFLNKDDFIDNYENNVHENSNNNSINESIRNFDISNIRDIENVNFYYTPYKKLLDKIILRINMAKSRVYVEVYMLTETRIKQALIDAKNRWLDVKIVLEKNPYKATNINNKHFSFLENAWINIVWSDPDDFSLNHSKFFIIDDEIILSTWNFTYSTFAFNRDLFLFFNDKKLLSIFFKIFNKDFVWDKFSIYDSNLILSPNYSRGKFEILFNSAEKNIDMYFQYLSDEKLENLLIKKALEWIKIRIVVSKDFYLERKDKIKKLEEKGIKIKYLKSVKMHSKAILIDDKYLFIWSVNFSRYSLDKNREIWVLLKNLDIISKFQNLFAIDFEK